jgi:hypothetical protein
LGNLPRAALRCVHWRVFIHGFVSLCERTCENSAGIFWQVNEFIIPHLTLMNGARAALNNAQKAKNPIDLFVDGGRRLSAPIPEGAGLGRRLTKIHKNASCTFQTLKCGGETRQPRYINACCVSERR